MFTGLIQGLGRVAGKQHTHRRTALLIETALAKELQLGDSVAVNGVCLTAARLDQKGFEADLMPETWQGTNLSRVRIGDLVNLEPALRSGERFGGHLVSGHVDGLGRVSRIRREGNALVVQITVPPEIQRWIIPKGSVAVNGVSLTVQHLVADGFVISLVPHTVKATTFQMVKVGDWVNLETDQLLKLKAAGEGRQSEQPGITKAFLAENGFIS